MGSGERGLEKVASLVELTDSEEQHGSSVLMREIDVVIAISI